ncbi:MAG: hypothetical protein UY74_C0035G0009 [Candidatus Kaiserbacteria bacterium GW2011_GWC2_52_8b]|uniref:Uncharacterized protein n=2 Tax=Candidatus Kaiseribacteriota TaxID=1752734 RepID=A0A0G1XIC1_9BACT|nr:MAG: hypothetical protein UY67_C0018G0010 [Candidatus Kaiserbacteria bacterium GW2011_GWA2_52_12]KKW30640.1 MAG: hypothetical protein UY74_C0035G0009 [Candidatus Kaiserbacteria bacterium GW2011_GWC2_52_8b]
MFDLRGRTLQGDRRTDCEVVGDALGEDTVVAECEMGGCEYPVDPALRLDGGIGAEVLVIGAEVVGRHIEFRHEGTHVAASHRNIKVAADDDGFLVSEDRFHALYLIHARCRF